MNRRGFLGAILAAAAAPAYVRVGSLMKPAPIWTPWPTGADPLYLPDIDAERVFFQTGISIGSIITISGIPGQFIVADTPVQSQLRLIPLRRN